MDYNGNDDYTVFLCHGDGADGTTVFTDSSPRGWPIIQYTSAQVDTAVKKFGTGSVMFPNGTASCIYVPYNAGITDWSFGTGDFTIDFWIYISGTPGDYRGIISTEETPGGTGWVIALKPSTLVPVFYYPYNFGTGPLLESSSAISATTWTHIAVVRYGTSLKMYMNGTQVASTTLNASDQINAGSSCGLMIGRLYYNYSGDYITSGGDAYLDEIRINKGLARWTAAFSVPTGAYGGGYGLDDYVKLLLRGNGVDGSTYIVDSSYYTPKAITVGGNAQIDTAQYKFDGSSILFDGSGDYIYAGDSDDWTSGSGDYTVDFWVRFNALTSGDGAQCFLAHITNTTNYWGLYVYESSGSYYLSLIQCISSFYNILIDSSALSLSTGTWYHIAMVKTGTTYKWFLNGLQVASTTETDVLDNFSQLNIATLDGSLYCLNGWLDTIRISKGIARWTADFTVPDKSYR